MIQSSYLTIDPSDHIKIYRMIAKIIGNELADIAKPCYRPRLISYKNDIMTVMKYKKGQDKEFKKQLKENMSKFGFLNDELTSLILMGIVHFAMERNSDITKLFYLLLCIKFYNNTVFKSFPKFCSDPLWSLALSRLSATHLFKSRGSIPGALVHITNSLYDIYSSSLQSDKINDITLIRVATDLRTRISQSVRSFAELYYKLQKENSGGVATADDREEVQGVDLISDKIASSMCTYGRIDSKSLDIAIKKSGINRDIGETIVENVSTVDHRNSVKFIIILMNRLAPIKNVCSENGRNGIIRKVVANIKIGNYTVKDEIIKMLYATEFGYRLKTLHSEQLVIFYMHYLTLYIRTLHC